MHGLSVPLYQQSPGEITRESLEKILEIMRRLAASEATPELLREIMEIGKVAIVADGGILWLQDRASRDLVMVVPASEPAPRLPVGVGVAGECAARRRIVTVSECRDDARFRADPVNVPGFETRSLLSVPIVGNEELLGVMQWLGAAPRQFDSHDEWVGPALAAAAAIAIRHPCMTNASLAQAMLAKNVAVASEIRSGILSRGLPRVDGYDLWTHSRRSGGGDLHDVVLLGRRLFLLLGSAAGDGFGPALSAMQMQAMLRVAFRLGADLDRAYVEVNNQLAEVLPDDRCITAFVGFLDPALHTVDFHSGRQGPVLHFRAARGECDWYQPTTFPMGTLPMIAAPPRRRLQLAEGDLLALASDGIYACTDAEGRQFDQERVAAVVRAHAGVPMRELGQRLVEEAARFTGGAAQKVDITLVLARRLPER